LSYCGNGIDAELPGSDGQRVYLELGQVAVVISLHLQVEDGCLNGGGGWDQVLVQQAQDLTADLVQLLLHHCAVLLNQLNTLLVALAELALQEKQAMERKTC
jgi:hypothetical protein